MEYAPVAGSFYLNSGGNGVPGVHPHSNRVCFAETSSCKVGAHPCPREWRGGDHVRPPAVAKHTAILELNLIRGDSLGCLRVVGFGMAFVGQPFHLVGEVHLRALVGHDHMAPAHGRLHEQELVTGAIPLVLIVVPLGLSQLGRQRAPGLSDQLGRDLIKAHHYPSTRTMSSFTAKMQWNWTSFVRDHYRFWSG